MYVIRDKATGLYCRNAGKHAIKTTSGPDYEPDAWTVDIKEARIIRTNRCKDAWWFSENYEMVPVTVIAGEVA